LRRGHAGDGHEDDEQDAGEKLHREISLVKM
jgi:hypothetical protein